MKLIKTTILSLVSINLTCSTISILDSIYKENDKDIPNLCSFLALFFLLFAGMIKTLRCVPAIDHTFEDKEIQLELFWLGIKKFFALAKTRKKGWEWVGQSNRLFLREMELVQIEQRLERMAKCLAPESMVRRKGGAGRGCPGLEDGGECECDGDRSWARSDGKKSVRNQVWAVKMAQFDLWKERKFELSGNPWVREGGVLSEKKNKLWVKRNKGLPAVHVGNLVEICAKGLGCCGRGCGCCMKPRGKGLDGSDIYAHCTMECGCCVRDRGFFCEPGDAECRDGYLLMKKPKEGESAYGFA